MIKFLTHNLVWLHGRQILVALGLATFTGFLFSSLLFYAALGLILFTLYFFRNPDRVCLEKIYDNTILISPADGKVVDIAYDENNSFDGYAQKVSIFLSAFDVHVNWTPIAGTITKVLYKPGKFMFAFLPKSSELNERNDIIIQTADGRSIKVRQIAGTVARRICCWVDEGQKVDASNKFGMIRFGSRVDIFLPANVHLAVKLGQRVYGGQTVLGRW